MLTHLFVLSSLAADPIVARAPHSSITAVFPPPGTAVPVNARPVFVGAYWSRPLFVDQASAEELFADTIADNALSVLSGSLTPGGVLAIGASCTDGGDGCDIAATWPVASAADEDDPQLPTEGDVHAHAILGGAGSGSDRYTVILTSPNSTDDNLIGYIAATPGSSAFFPAVPGDTTTGTLEIATAPHAGGTACVTLAALDAAGNTAIYPRPSCVDLDAVPRPFGCHGAGAGVPGDACLAAFVAALGVSRMRRRAGRQGWRARGAC